MKLTGLTWWIDRWRKSTAFTDMSLEEQAAYRNLLDEAWLRGGSLPFNDRSLAKASGDATRWPEVRDAVLQRFVKGADGWHNETLDRILHESIRSAIKQRAYRLRGNKAGNGVVTNVVTNTVTKKGSGSGSGSDLKEKRLFRCSHDPPCDDKRECAIRKRRAAGL